MSGATVKGEDQKMESMNVCTRDTLKSQYSMDVILTGGIQLVFLSLISCVKRLFGVSTGYSLTAKSSLPAIRTL